MSIDILGVSFDAHDAAKIARFWADVLHRTVGEGAAEDFATVPADDATAGPLLMFHGVPEGKTVKNRMHFDLVTADVTTEVDRLHALGARQLRTLADNDGRWISFVDPEGNEFDLVVR